MDKANHIDQYPLIRQLGRGGMGSVWLSHHPTLDIPVAIKILQVKNQSNTDEYRKRFIKEGMLAASIEHAHLVRIYDAGATGYNHYLVMEYIDGEDMGKLLKNAPQGIPEEQVLDTAISLTQALKCAHKKGIIHRDLKPDNIMMTQSGTLKLTDLGIAKDLEERNGVTTTGVALGTPHYIAPEQALNAADADQRSDIYTLGATLYHLLTGSTPFQGETPLKVMMQHVQSPLDHPKSRKASADDGLCSIICKMMEKRPEMRYQSCSELLNDLQNLKMGLSITADSPFDSLSTPISRDGNKTSKPSSKNKNLIISLSLSCLAALGLLFYLNRQTDPVEIEAQPIVSPKPTKKLAIPAKQSSDRPRPLSKQQNLLNELKSALQKLQEQNDIASITEAHYSLENGKISLDLSDNIGLTNLTSLEGLAIEKLNIDGSSVSSLEGLKNCPLKKLSARHVDIALSQLKDLPLEELSLGYVSKLQLPDLPLKKLALIHFSGTDLSTLKNLPLEELIISSGAPFFSSEIPLKRKSFEILRLIKQSK